MVEVRYMSESRFSSSNSSPKENSASSANQQSLGSSSLRPSIEKRLQQVEATTARFASGVASGAAAMRKKQ